MTVLWLGRDCYVHQLLKHNTIAQCVCTSYPICYFSGLGEECLVNNEEIQELKKRYATVMPICFVCMHDGKKTLLPQAFKCV